MVKETVAMVYGLTNRNCPITTTPLSPLQIYLHGCVVPEKLLTNIFLNLYLQKHKKSVYSKSLTPRFMITTDPAVINGHQAIII